MRGSKVAALRYREAEAMVLLDMIGDGSLSIPREFHSDEALWARLRAAARRTGVQAVFPDETAAASSTTTARSSTSTCRRST